MRCVLDASLALALVVEDESSELAQRLIDSLDVGDELLAPEIWSLDVANALVTRFRSGSLSEPALSRTSADLKQLPVRLVSFSLPEVLDEVGALARARGLTAYDACYLHLALREQLPLATADRRLGAAAQAAGCALFA